jgi:hypothetical protein
MMALDMEKFDSNQQMRENQQDNLLQINRDECVLKNKGNSGN